MRQSAVLDEVFGGLVRLQSAVLKEVVRRVLKEVLAGLVRLQSAVLKEVLRGLVPGVFEIYETKAVHLAVILFYCTIGAIEDDQKS